MFGNKTRKLLDETNLQMSRLNDTVEGFLELQKQRHDIVPIVKEKSSPQDTEGPVVVDEKTKKQAAYALNLCSVSISQIVDYNDLNVLEQEYEGILNNLNIEHFPKDDALLNILKHILDTVTFFRIQEGDKQFIERDYQQKMKNAIWSSVPNFGVIVASGNPFVMLMSLASQVGMGYMNYRKQKAENTLEYEKEKWKLQRAAIEQFNGLRRELFDTAWRLADKYGFPDEYRLTENQIRHYNNILMDSDRYRMDERLASVESQFKAYPPYWYQRGHNAACIALISGKDSTMFNKYASLAITSFRIYVQINQSELLRTDIVAASCYLELAGLLSPEHNREEIIDLIGKASMNAGTHNDIRQLCANAYLAIGERRLAEKYLRELVVENYNAVANAQLLSSLYCTDTLQGEMGHTSDDYETLKMYIDPRYLMPLPTTEQLSDGNQIDDIARSMMDAFLQRQKGNLKVKCEKVLDAMDEKYTIKLNRSYQDVGKRQADEYFLDSEARKEQRRHDINQYFLNRHHVVDYKHRISSFSLEYDLISYLNDYVNAISQIKSINFNVECIDSAIKDYINIIRAVDKSIKESTFDISTIDKIQSISFDKFTSAFRKEIKEKYSRYVDILRDLNEISIAEEELNCVCARIDISTPDELFTAPQRQDVIINQHTIQLKATNSFINSEAEREKVNKARQICEGFNFSVNDKNIRYITSDKDIDYYRERCKSFLKDHIALNSSFNKKEIIAIISNNQNGFSDKDVFFTPYQLFRIRTRLFKKDEYLSCPYDKIELDNYTGALTCDGIQIVEKNPIVTNNLHDMILDLQKME